MYKIHIGVILAKTMNDFLKFLGISYRNKSVFYDSSSSLSIEVFLSCTFLLLNQFYMLQAFNEFERERNLYDVDSSDSYYEDPNMHIFDGFYHISFFDNGNPRINRYESFEIEFCKNLEALNGKKNYQVNPSRKRVRMALYPKVKCLFHVALQNAYSELLLPYLTVITSLASKCLTSRAKDSQKSRRIIMRMSRTVMKVNTSFISI